MSLVNNTSDCTLTSDRALGSTFHSSTKIRTIEKILSSGFGALLTSVIVTPFDVVKTRLQAQEKIFLKKKCFVYYNGLWDHICYCDDVSKASHNRNNFSNCMWYRRPSHFTGTFDAFIKIIKFEGITSLWSGLPPTLVMAVPATVLYYTVYDLCREKVCQALQTKHPPFWEPSVAGACARVLTVTAVSPVEFIRTKLQSKRMNYSDVSKAVSEMIKQKGIKSLWHGWSPTILRDVPFSAIYWTIYESAKQYSDVTEPSVFFSFIVGAGAGTVSAFLTFPFDVVKTHRQVELGETDIFNGKRKISTKDILINLYKEKGVKVLYTGLVPRLIKIAPSCAIMISSYEYGKMYFMEKRRRQNI